jgi:hypothetical protein
MTDAERLALMLQQDRSVPMATPTGEFIPTPPLNKSAQVSPYNPIGLGETALSLGTGAIAAPLAGWYGAGTELFGGDGKAAAGRLADALTYKPTTDYGQASASAFSDFADKTGISSLPPVVSGIPTPRLGAGATRYAGQQYGVPMLEKSLTMYEQGKLTPGFNPVSDIFIGENAKSWNAIENIKAKELEASGVKPREIWQQTMNWKGPEGIWRQEIDDSGAGLNIKQIQDMPKYTDTIKTHEALTHPGLYENYPAFQYYGLGYEDSPNVRGSFNPKDQKFTVGGGFTLNKPETTKSTLLHEIQHAVQDKEDFARGANPDVMSTVVSELQRNELSPIRKNATEWRYAATEAGRADRELYMHKLDKLSVSEKIQPRRITGLSDFYEFSDKIRSEFGPMPKRAGFQRDEWMRNAAQYIKERNLERKPDLINYVDKDPKDLQNQVRRASRLMDKYGPDARQYSELLSKYKQIGELSPIEQYTRTGGEAEARATQARMNMDMEQRRATFPEDSYDVDTKKLILFNKKNLPALSRKELLEQEFNKLEN